MSNSISIGEELKSLCTYSNLSTFFKVDNTKDCQYVYYPIIEICPTEIPKFESDKLEEFQNHTANFYVGTYLFHVLTTNFICARIKKSVVLCQIVLSDHLPDYRNAYYSNFEVR